MICTTERDTGQDWIQVFHRYRQESATPTQYSMETRILRLEDEFWRIRTDTGELAGTERNALRAYLDEKGFKTAMIDENLVIAGKLTWTEVFEPIEGFYEGKADVYPF
jgi:hypothetical protein